MSDESSARGKGESESYHSCQGILDAGKLSIKNFIELAIANAITKDDNVLWHRSIISLTKCLE
jgi:hypothetical protein